MGHEILTVSVLKDATTAKDSRTVLSTVGRRPRSLASEPGVSIPGQAFTRPSLLIICVDGRNPNTPF
jgi:hypothetical protein